MSDTSSLLVAPIQNGQVADTSSKTTSTEKETRGTNDLGKDAFLQLLVAEMKHQDPLEPTTNTEWISQLATFSQLEELQSLTGTTEKTQIFSLIGKQVTVKTTDPNGKTYVKSGTVDYVSTQGSETKFSVNGALYSLEDLYTVVDSDYYYQQNQPSVPQEVDFVFDGDAPKDLEFKVNLGNDIAAAKDVALTIGNTVLSNKYAYLSGDTVYVKKELMNQLEPGIYNIDVVFDDKNYTTVYNAVKITVFNPHPVEEGQGIEETDTEEVISEE
ncbi:MAG: hypothetical protein MJ124_02185 [Lachnospiraceae bacterium]|nr:hypothetical protein [Lachnospiraceae bacterium]